MKPHSLNILYEDSDIIVCLKPHGLATQSKSFSSPDLEKMLLNHIAKAARANGKPANPASAKVNGKSSIQTSNSASGKSYLAVIHRLDQPVAGVLVFAKTPQAAKELNKQLQQSSFGKHYYALVQGTPAAPSGTLEDYLVKDGRTNSSKVCDKDTKDAKLARLTYQIVEKNTFPAFDLSVDSDTTLLEVTLDTGRHHQIRVQLSHMGCPIVGDTKYNPAASTDNRGVNHKTLCLCAYKLTFKHPRTKKEMHFEYPDV